ncbi:aluminum-activated malate transporter 12 [Nicotiana attenuata]|uniref:Aluminum-activated malate transporter 12 n=2 Tax=Nicotiana attenuata TaxID=49451 RepID=A0A1J6K5T5_NICAT|nr:aluminum-activated malate transporter 12 [Nicotiana attenuata]
MFKDPCIRLAGEVTKALKELGDSIRYRRQCSPEILSDHLHEALQDLDNAIKSQPKLFIGSKNNSNKLALATIGIQSGALNSRRVTLSSVKTDTSALLEWKSKRGSTNENNERKSLRPTLSKIAITSLEFSDALPFAAFAALLVEIVARLDLVIEEVEELGRIAHFKEYNNSQDDDHNVVVDFEKHAMPLRNELPTHAGD